MFSYLIEQNVCYMCLCQGAYPKPLAFSYLQELQKEFSAMYAAEVATVARPYAFVRFGKHILTEWVALFSIRFDRLSDSTHKKAIQGPKSTKQFRPCECRIARCTSDHAS